MTDRSAMRWYRPTAAGLILIAAAATFCAWSGRSYWQSRHDDGVRVALARDAVARAGRRQIAALNTLDPKQSDATLRAWLDASSGPLHDELARASAQNRQKIAQARAAATGTVTGLAVTELDTRAGTARVIATVRVALGDTGTGRKRFSAVLARTGARWRLTALTAIPVGAS